MSSSPGGGEPASLKLLLLLLAAAKDREVKRVADLVIADGFGERLDRAGHIGVIRLDEDVVSLKAGFVGRAVLKHVADHQAFLIQIELRGKERPEAVPVARRSRVCLAVVRRRRWIR